MNNKEQKNFGYLGYQFQIKVLAQLLTDKKFADNVLPLIGVDYFDNQYCQMIVKKLKIFYNKYNTTPTFGGLYETFKTDFSEGVSLKYIKDTINEIKAVTLSDTDWVQETSFKFCKQQELNKALKRANRIMDKGEFDRYDEIHSFISDALNIDFNTDDGEDVFANLDSVLVDDYRDTIPLGIDGLDNLLNGGLAKGEVGVILAPMGVGKSTFLTKIANTAYNNGKTVLQIFFEDTINEIKRKHVSCWTGVPLPELNSDLLKDTQIIKAIDDAKKIDGRLILKRWPSDTITITTIKNFIRKKISDGVKIDLVVIDYIDCILPEKGTNDIHVDEGRTMRKFEAMCHEMNLAGWAATQGNRQSISSDIVTNDQMGGSIKKAQIGHVVISIAKTLQQKESGLATMALLKSRLGKDGIVFENCIFKNESMIISTEQSETFLGFEENRVERFRNVAANAYARRRARQENVNQEGQIEEQENNNQNNNNL